MIFHPWKTLDALGIRYSVTRERIRQIQVKATRRLAWYVRQEGSLIAQVLNEMADAVPDEEDQSPHSWFGAELARQGCHGEFIEFMLMTFLRRNKVAPKEARRLVEQAMP